MDGGGAVQFVVLALMGCGTPCDRGEPNAEWIDPGFNSVRIALGPAGPLYVGKDYTWIQWVPISPRGRVEVEQGQDNPDGVEGVGEALDEVLAATPWYGGVRTVGTTGSVYTTAKSTSSVPFDLDTLGSDAVLHQVWPIEGGLYASYTATDGPDRVAGLASIDSEDRVTPIGEPFYREPEGAEEDPFVNALAPHGGWDGQELWIDLWERHAGVRVRLDGTLVETFEPAGGSQPYFVDQVFLGDRWLGIQAEYVYPFDPRDWDYEPPRVHLFTDYIGLTSASTLVRDETGEVWAAASDGGVAVVKHLLDAATLEFEETARVRVREHQCYVPIDVWW